MKIDARLVKQSVGMIVGGVILHGVRWTRAGLTALRKERGFRQDGQHEQSKTCTKMKRRMILSIGSMPNSMNM